MAGREFMGRVVCIVALGAVAVSGCGESDSSQIRAAFTDLQQAFGARDYEGMCAVTTSDAQRHVGTVGHEPPSGCERDMRRFAVMMRQSRVGDVVPKITGLSVDGDRATAVIAMEGRPAGELPFAEEDGDWKVDALYGSIPAGLQQDKFPSPAQ